MMGHKICCDPSLELSWQDSSDDGSENMFLLRNMSKYPSAITVTSSYLQPCPTCKLSIQGIWKQHSSRPALIPTQSDQGLGFSYLPCVNSFSPCMDPKESIETKRRLLLDYTISQLGLSSFFACHWTYIEIFAQEICNI